MSHSKTALGLDKQLDKPLDKHWGALSSNRRQSGLTEHRGKGQGGLHPVVKKRSSLPRESAGDCDVPFLRPECAILKHDGGEETE